MANSFLPGCHWWCLFVLSFFPMIYVLDEILDLFESVAEGLPTYFYIYFAVKPRI